MFAKIRSLFRKEDPEQKLCDLFAQIVAEKQEQEPANFNNQIKKNVRLLAEEKKKVEALKRELEQADEQISALVHLNEELRQENETLKTEISFIHINTIDRRKNL